jgi:hypothetical protein
MACAFAVGGWSHPQEDTPEMGGTHTKLRTQRRKIHGLKGVCFEIPANFADHVGLDPHSIAGMTSASGAKTGLFRRFTARKEKHLSPAFPFFFPPF